MIRMSAGVMAAVAALAAWAPLRAQSVVRYQLSLTGVSGADNTVDPDQTPQIGWEATCEVTGANQGAATLIADLKVHKNTVTGPLATQVVFLGDNSNQAAGADEPIDFSYGLTDPLLPAARIIDPVGDGGANMAFFSAGSVRPGRVELIGAGYTHWQEPSTVRPGVGRDTMPDGGDGLGIAPVFEGRLDISNLDDGVYWLELAQSGYEVNVLRDDVDLSQPVGRFARSADSKPNASVRFTVQRDGGDDGSGGGGGGGAPPPPPPPPPDGDGDGVPDADDVCPGGDDGVDEDGDGVPDACDVCLAGDDALDADGDTVPDECDNCVDAANTDQVDTDADGRGDVCDDTPDGVTEPSEPADPPDDTIEDPEPVEDPDPPAVDDPSDGDTNGDPPADDNGGSGDSGNKNPAPRCGSGTAAASAMMAAMLLMVRHRRRRF